MNTSTHTTQTSDLTHRTHDANITSDTTQTSHHISSHTHTTHNQSSNIRSRSTCYENKLAAHGARVVPMQPLVDAILVEQKLTGQAGYHLTDLQVPKVSQHVIPCVTVFTNYLH
jgi:hypothetical protein